MLFVVDCFMILFELYDIKINKIEEPIMKNRRVVIINFAFIVFNIIKSYKKLVFKGKLYPLLLLNTLIVSKFYLVDEKIIGNNEC